MTDEESYKLVLKNNNVTEEEVQKQVNRDDVLPTLKNVYVKESEIHGLGCFTDRIVRKHCIICPARIRDKRTIAGRYCNHAENPNAFSKVMWGSFVLIAHRRIEKDEEITLDYQQVINVNKSVS